MQRKQRRSIPARVGDPPLSALARPGPAAAELVAPACGCMVPGQWGRGGLPATDDWWW
jgi:hypothetical protein